MTLLLREMGGRNRIGRNFDNNLILEETRLLIDHGADVNRLFEGKTPLMTVCELAWRLKDDGLVLVSELIDLLLGRGADVNAKDDQGRTALMYSLSDCLRSDSLNGPVIRKLIESGADVNAIVSGDTPLLYFAKTVTRPGTWHVSSGREWIEKKARGIAENIEIFIGAGADVNHADGDGVTPLMAFAANGAFDAVRVLVEAGADVRARDALGRGVIPRAFSDEIAVDLDGLTYLIDAANDKAFLSDENGPSILARNVKEGYYRNEGEFAFFGNGYLPAFFTERLLKFDWTRKEKDDALLGATFLGRAFYFDKIGLLLKNGADINARDANGMTLLMNAPRATSSDVSRLIEMGLDVNARGPGGGTILTMDSISRQTPEFISALLEGGADVSAADDQGRTCLSVAHTAQCLRLLLDAGANPKIVRANGRTPLHDALPYDPEALAVLISAGVDVNGRDDDGKTALLSWMERGGNPDGIRLLLDAGADAALADFAGNSPLMLAMSYGKLSGDHGSYYFPYSGYGLYTRDFLKSGPDTNAVFPGGDTPLLMLIKQPLSLSHRPVGQYIDTSDVFREAIFALFDHGADADARDASGLTAWDYARERGADPRKLEWLKKAAKDVKIPAATGRTRLMVAAADGSARRVARLIEDGESVGASDGLGWTALAHAAWSGANPKIIRLLVDNGADVNARDLLGKTPLMRAVRHNSNPKVVRALLDAGARVGVRDRWGATAVRIAIDHDAPPETIVSLFRAGAKITDRNRLGGQMLRASSAATENPKTIRALIRSGAPVDDRDDDGQTALMKAVSRNTNPGVTKALIDCGADINARDNKGLSVLDFALKGSAAVYRILANAGVDLKTESAWWTPAEKGMMQKNPDQMLWNAPRYRW